MTTLAIQSKKTREQVASKDEFQTPAHALRARPVIADLPKDRLGQDIAFLLARNPEIRNGLGEINLGSMSVPDKVNLLGRIKTQLGIRPPRSRRVGYVGP